MSNQFKPKIDPMKKIIARQDAKQQLKRPATLGVNAKALDWREHAAAKHLIANFSTIEINEKSGLPMAHFYQAPDDCVMFVQLEDLGDHGEAYIVMYQKESWVECMRKNMKNVDLLNWMVVNEEEEAPIQEESEIREQDRESASSQEI